MSLPTTADEISAFARAAGPLPHSKFTREPEKRIYVNRAVRFDKVGWHRQYFSALR